MQKEIPGSCIIPAKSQGFKRIETIYQKNIGKLRQEGDICKTFEKWFRSSTDRIVVS